MRQRFPQLSTLAVLIGALIMAVFVLSSHARVVRADDDVFVEAYPPIGVVGDVIEFWADTRDGETCRWDFGDGRTSAEVDPAIAYAAPGTYLVSVTVSGGAGGDRTGSLTLAITSADQPVVLVTYLQDRGNINFWSDVAGGVTPYSYCWHFDADEVCDLKFNGGTHEFPPGDHVVRLVVTDAKGKTAETQVTIRVDEERAKAVDLSAPGIATTECVDCEGKDHLIIVASDDHSRHATEVAQLKALVGASYEIHEPLVEGSQLSSEADRLRALLDKLENEGNVRTLLVFYRGHGTHAPNPKLAFSNKNSELPLTELFEEIAEIEACTVGLVYDSCYSGCVPFDMPAGGIARCKTMAAWSVWCGEISICTKGVTEPFLASLEAGSSLERAFESARHDEDVQEQGGWSQAWCGPRCPCAERCGDGTDLSEGIDYGIPEGDRDRDTVIDADDNCPDIPNRDQKDADGDGLGDVCDPYPCPEDMSCLECCTVKGGDQAHVWACFEGCGMDADEDGVPDSLDNCPAVPNPAQEDANGDGVGDACE